MELVQCFSEWIDHNSYMLQLQAAWLRLTNAEPPLNPRIAGEPGLGKTTLARAVGRSTNRQVYIFQCPMDTRPEDLVITPVLAGERLITYRASAVATAVIDWTSRSKHFDVLQGPILAKYA